MFTEKVRTSLTFTLALAISSASAQNPQETQQMYDEQRRARQAAELEKARRLEDQQNFDVTLQSIERDRERAQERSVPAGGGSDNGSNLAPALMILIIGGALLAWSRTPRAQRPAIVYVEETRRQREGLIYGQCKSIRRSGLVAPKVHTGRPMGIFRLFMEDKSKTFREAHAKYDAALREVEPTCKCVGEVSVSANGFSEQEWTRIAENTLRERPWDALDEGRTRSVFSACSAKSPSDEGLSWLHATASR